MLLWLCRFNTAVFNERLPADLEIAWSAHLKTTAGTTHFRREPAPFPGAKPRYGAQRLLPLPHTALLQPLYDLPSWRYPVSCRIQYDIPSRHMSGACSSRCLCPGSDPRNLDEMICSGCRYSASVQLATKVIDTEAKLRATLLHELCHVATWVLPPHVAKVSSQQQTASRSANMPLTL